MFGHEKLDVYRLSIELAAYPLETIRGVPKGNQDFVSQLRRAVTSIPANIAEGVGKTGEDDRKRYFSIARGSATEAAAWYDILGVAALLTSSQIATAKAFLERIVAMLSALCIR